MKLKELNAAIAAACNVQPSVIASVQNETFKQIRAALDKGEKVAVAGFGMFATREVPGAGGAEPTKQIRFRARIEEEGKGDKGDDRAARREKRAAKAAKTGVKKPETGEDD